MTDHPTNRKPVYIDSTRRVVSRPNGLWRAEYRVDEHGTRERDCWRPESSDIRFEEALRKA